jgi:hypothetical protein
VRSDPELKDAVNSAVAGEDPEETAVDLAVVVAIMVIKGNLVVPEEPGVVVIADSKLEN